ncbi:hypothetical protein [Marinobacter sp.]|uniref:hypothetical protein n=1 Tax=Marinobacter sp. TaxID=50741 RepID=UPI003A8FF837
MKKSCRESLAAQRIEEIAQGLGVSDCCLFSLCLLLMNNVGVARCSFLSRMRMSKTNNKQEGDSYAS